MREIEFRGRDKDGYWVYGDLMTKHAHHAGLTIVHGGWIYYEVDSETVGQYTGLKDRNGVKIFEGDIVDFGFGRGEVWFDDGTFKHTFIEKGEDGGLINSVRPSKRFWDKVEIIGNIHDNPELLEVER